MPLASLTGRTAMGALAAVLFVVLVIAIVAEETRVSRQGGYVGARCRSLV